MRAASINSSAPPPPPSSRGAQRAAPPPKFDRYELLSEIARGGMGVVYRARDKVSGDVCALKCLHVREHRHADIMLEGFEREYQVLRGLKHPRIIEVYDYGVIEGGAFYTMELLEGADLRGCAPVPWGELCQYLRDIATCLSLLHARRLIHRDLSPGNVKRTRDGHCKLLDFGALVEFGQADIVVGTPPFIAPEVLAYGRLDQRVDLYALGALGYYCLTGCHAYPAQHIDDLPEVWKRLPIPPSRYNDEVPPELDDLLMSLLREDPLARPTSAAEVIARLEVIGQLPAEEEAGQRLLVQSFLVAPRYVGRKEELARAASHIRAAVRGHGKALRVVGPAGAGRSRFLEEVAIHAQLAGGVVLRADASAQRGRYGALRALADSMLQTIPETARTTGLAHRTSLSIVDPQLEARVMREQSEISLAAPYVRRRFSSAPPPHPGSSRRATPANPSVPPDFSRIHGVEQWFLDVSQEHPLVLLVDNLEYADDASLGALLALARSAQHERILLVFTEAAEVENAKAFGLAPLRAASETLPLGTLAREELVELMRSIFGDAARVERLAEWLHAQTAGSPLYCLGLVRHLVAQGAIRNERGAWVLPSSRPETQVSEALEDALARRLESLSLEARELAQCLSLQRLDTTVELCRRLVPPDAARSAPMLLEELAAHDVMHRDQERCFFSSAALRQAVLKRMGGPSRRSAHLKLGQALAALASDDLALRIEAGWHLIRGGDEMRGADMIAEVTQDSVACNVLVANLYNIGAPVEAALKVYRSARKSRRERMPLLNTLAQAGYYEHYRWAEVYGDDALDVAEELSGLGLARRLRRFIGRPLALAISVGFAVLLHYLTPRKQRGGSFINLLMHVCSTVTSLSGVAAISLDPDRCDRVAEVLAPAAILPKRIALVGIYQFCVGLQQIAREHQTEAFARFDELAARFAEPHYYLFMPPEANPIYFTACHFARGAFALMRANGAAALESAEHLERSGLPLYVMIASQLRYLYHINRGELSLALVHRERVEMHAARVGSAWQVELWEPASLMPFYLATEDVIELPRIAHRLAELAESVPAMWRYREISDMAAELHTRRPNLILHFHHLLTGPEPRSFIGWSTTLAGGALYHNHRGEHDQALALLEPVLATMSDADREYVMIFLMVDLQLALAEAGLGRTDDALGRLEHLLSLHGKSGHPLTLGLAHEMRASIAFAIGRLDVYEESAREASRWLRPTGTPALVARCDRLERLAIASAAVQPEVAKLADYVATGIASSETRVDRRSVIG